MLKILIIAAIFMVNAFFIFKNETMAFWGKNEIASSYSRVDLGDPDNLANGCELSSSEVIRWNNVRFLSKCVLNDKFLSRQRCVEDLINLNCSNICGEDQAIIQNGEDSFKKNKPAKRVLAAKAPMPLVHKVVDGRRVCGKKNDKPKKSKKGVGRHMDMECCLDPDEIPNPNCYYPPEKYGKYL